MRYRAGRRRLEGQYARCSGFTYLAVLFMVALIGFGLAGAATFYASALQRERELELLFAGQQYRQAIGSYYERTPGAVKLFPTALAQLLRDDRYPVTVRHLRKLYPDPMSGKHDWVLIKRPDGQIVGVASASQAVPFKVDNFDNPLDRDFRAAATLADWKFIYGAATTPAPAVPGALPAAGIGSPIASPPASVSR
ncbi:MAG: type II secretion system protein [Burkholderiales bacterium]|nr:type II secretion system protein [Burkholderiales bacterium]